MNRSQFFKLSLAGGLGIESLLSRGVAAAARTEPGPLPRRPLGKTGEHLSIIGLCGIVVSEVEQSHADQVVREAFEKGINYFDVAPSYGNAQDRLGPALEPYRKQVFLACKTTERDRAGSERELNQSLKTLRTDYLDLYQLHAITTREDIDKIFAPGGALETFVRAKKEGKVRFLGFSAHSVEAALAAMERYDFDTILFPINYVAWFKGNFGPQVVEKANEKGMGILALKAGAHHRFGKGEKNKYGKCWYLPLESEEEIARSYYFTLSLPVTACLPPGEEQFFRLALKVATSFVPPGELDRKNLQAAAAETANPIFEYPSWKG